MSAEMERLVEELRVSREDKQALQLQVGLCAQLPPGIAGGWS